jgi:hypothetical protein
LVANTDPLLKWVLYAEPGTARLVQVNPVTGVATTAATHTFATHWLPIGVANDKLLWQRTDTGETTLWTIAANGAYVSHTAIVAPSPTWRARGISLDQEGACPLPAAGQRTYSILWEGPAPGGWFAWPRPRVSHHDHLGAQSSIEEIPERYSWTELREFRHSVDGYSALIHRPTLQVVGGDNTNLTWYGRDANGALQRLRTDTYTAAGGYTACVAHQPNVQCFNDFVDEAPGAGHSFTSLVTTATAGGSQLPATYLLWSKSDGTAKNYRVSLYGGQLLGPAAPIITPHVGSAAVSLTGQAPNLCPIMVDPRGPAGLADRSGGRSARLPGVLIGRRGPGSPRGSPGRASSRSSRVCVRHHGNDSADPHPHARSVSERTTRTGDRPYRVTVEAH